MSLEAWLATANVLPDRIMEFPTRLRIRTIVIDPIGIAIGRVRAQHPMGAMLIGAK